MTLNELRYIVAVAREPVSYTHLDVYKRQAHRARMRFQQASGCLLYTSREPSPARIVKG